MNKLVTALFLASVWQIAYCTREGPTLGPNLQQQSKIFHDICIQLTGANDEMIGEVKDGNFDDSNEVIKKYVTCIWLVGGVIDLNLKNNLQRLAYFWPEDLDNEQFAGYILCASKYKDADLKFPDKIWEMNKCIYKQAPNDYIFF